MMYNRVYDPEVIELAQTTIYSYDDCEITKIVFGDQVKSYLTLFASLGFTSSDVHTYCMEFIMLRDKAEMQGFVDELKENEK